MNERSVGIEENDAWRLRGPGLGRSFRLGPLAHGPRPSAPPQPLLHAHCRRFSRLGRTGSADADGDGVLKEPELDAFATFMNGAPFSDDEKADMRLNFEVDSAEYVTASRSAEACRA